jgi:hypothetical protein
MVMKLTLRMISVMETGYGTQYADGCGGQSLIGGKHTINALIRRGLARRFDDNQRFDDNRGAYLTPAGIYEMRRILAERRA